MCNQLDNFSSFWYMSAPRNIKIRVKLDLIELSDKFLVYPPPRKFASVHTYDNKVMIMLNRKSKKKS